MPSDPTSTPPKIGNETVDREQWRLHLMYSYVPRWFRPSFRGAFKNITNDPALLQRSSPSALPPSVPRSFRADDMTRVC